MSEVEFVDEAEVVPSGTRRSKYTRIAETLDQNPGKWAVIHRQGKESDNSARARKYAFLKAVTDKGLYDVVTRDIDGQVVVFAMRKDGQA